MDDRRNSLGILANNGIKGSEAGTALNSKVTSPNPVEVEIRFIMTDGELPTKTVIDGVAAYLQDENIRPLTDKVTVLAPETVKFNIAFTYYVNLSDQSKAGTIQAEVAQAVADYIEWQTRTIGRDTHAHGSRYCHKHMKECDLDCKESGTCAHCTNYHIPMTQYPCKRCEKLNQN